MVIALTVERILHVW